MRLDIWRTTLTLAHDFKISRWSSTEKHNVFVRFTNEGVSGLGEAAPNLRYDETPDSAEAALKGWASEMSGDPNDYAAFLAAIPADDQWAAHAALEMAVMDWVAKKAGRPLRNFLNLPQAPVPPTSMTIAIADPGVMAERAREASAFKYLKVKLGSGDDRGMITEIRKASNQIIRVDANEGWRDREQAIKEIEWLADQNVELIEQPMPAQNTADMAWLKTRSPVPLIADEAFTHQLDQLGQLAEGYHGINIKLMKTGGILFALRAIETAKKLKLQIMIGCMIESGIGIAAALQLASLADYVDLDGNLLLTNDPYPAHSVEKGRHILNDLPGLGVKDPG